MIINYFYNRYYNFSKILFLFLPISLISGPFLSDLTAVLMSILVIFFLIKNKRADYLKNYFIIFGVIFYIYIVIVSINSQNPLLSLESSLFYIRFILFALCIRIFLDDDNNIIKYFFYVLGIGVLILFISSLYDLFDNNFDNEKKARVSGLFRDELVLGSYLIRTFPLFLAIYFLENIKLPNKKFFGFIFFVIFLIMIFLSGERAAILLTMLYLLFLFLNIKINIRIIYSYIFILILGSVFFMINKDYYNRIIVDTYDQFFIEKKNPKFNNLNIKTKSTFFDFQKIKTKKNFFKIENFEKFNKDNWFYSADFKFLEINNIEGVFFMANFANDSEIASEDRSGLIIFNNKVFLMNKTKGKSYINSFESLDIKKSLKKDQWNAIKFAYTKGNGFKLIVNGDHYSNILKNKKFINDKKNLLLTNIYDLTINGRTDPNSKNLFTEVLYADTKNINLSFQDFTSTNSEKIVNELDNKKYNKIVINEIANSINFKDHQSFYHYKEFNFLPNSHENLLITSYYIFQDHIFFGAGPKMFRYLCSNYSNKENSCSTHPHNTYFQLMAETGIIGTFLVLLFFLTSLLNTYRNRYNFFKASIYIMIVINFWPLITTGSFFNNWLSILYFIPIGFILKDFDIKKFKNYG